MDTMKAVRILQYGGEEVLVHEGARRPNPRGGEVLIRVYAAGVNPVDWRTREAYPRQFHPSIPLIFGWDVSGFREVSGVVEATGPGVSGLRKGDEVYALSDVTSHPAYAEYIVVKESEVALKPTSIDLIHAAAIPLAALTAWQSLFDAAQLKSGQSVLIHAAAGAVGSFAVQLAKWKGARVIGTGSNHDFLRDLGASETIDYQTTPFEDVVRDVDLVLDTMGGDTQNRSWKVLKKGGMLLSIIDPPSPEEAIARGILQAYVSVQPNAGQLTEIAKLVDSGKLRPVVETVLPLSEAYRAHQLSQTGHMRGKIVLCVV